jgi:hypothetical protein
MEGRWQGIGKGLASVCQKLSAQKQPTTNERKPTNEETNQIGV